MPTQNTFNPLTVALSDLYSRATTMVRRLGASRISPSTSLAEIRGFQLAWNQYLGETNAWLGSIGFVAEGTTRVVLTDGLDDDGKYGPQTAHALVVLLYVAGLPERLAATLPTTPTNMPLWYAQNQSVVEGVLLNAMESDNMPQPEPVYVDDGAETAEQLLENAHNAVSVVDSNTQTIEDTTGGDLVFDDGSTITSAAGRTAWNVPVWAVGIGVVTLGGLLFAVARRRKKGARIPV